MTLEQENEAFEKIWDDLMDEHQIKPELPPKGFVLGGATRGRKIKSY